MGIRRSAVIGAPAAAAGRSRTFNLAISHRGSFKGKTMKAVLFYESNDTPIEKIMEAFPRHKALLDAFHQRGELLAVGAFANPKQDGSMGVFKNKESAEAFVKQDPFQKEGLVGKSIIKEWNEIYLG
jgi:uncharacterized protein YciI